VKLFARSLQLDFAGEGAPHPVVDGSTNAATVGPVKKILIGAGITEELQNANPETATAIIGRVLSEAAAKSLDAYVFDNVAGDAVRPPGLLNGVTPIAATAGGGTNAMAKWKPPPSPRDLTARRRSKSVAAACCTLRTRSHNRLARRARPMWLPHQLCRPSNRQC
jgi:hypothetical protein